MPKFEESTHSPGRFSSAQPRARRPLFPVGVTANASTHRLLQFIQCVEIVSWDISSSLSLCLPMALRHQAYRRHPAIQVIPRTPRWIEHRANDARTHRKVAEAFTRFALFAQPNQLIQRAPEYPLGDTFFIISEGLPTPGCGCRQACRL